MTGNFSGTVNIIGDSSGASYSVTSFNAQDSTSASAGDNLAIEQEDKSYFPSTSDYDRFLFLEAIHSAKETLLISYSSQEKGSSKEQQPSLVVEELFCYLDRYYTIKGESVLEQCRFIHPLDPFDKSYFAKKK